MDLNYLFHRQQIERSRAAAASSEEARKAHEELAREYEREIERVSRGEVNFDRPAEAKDGGDA
jgi:hypothetical protein